MAEDGRPSDRGHCLLALPRALWLLVTRVMLRPSRWRAWLAADTYPPEAAEAPDRCDEVDEAFERAHTVVQQARDMVIRPVTFDVLGEKHTLVGNLRYRRTDPFAVEATFSFAGGGEVVTWSFARDLLHWGAVDREHAGHADVRVYERDRNTLVLALSSPGGSIALAVPRADITEFLRETYQGVPRGAESAHLGLDAALAELLREEAL